VTRAVVAFGANLGDVAATFAKVYERLGNEPGVESVASSSLYETVPVGGPAGQPTFLNGAFAVETKLDVESFFAQIKRSESALGRERKETWGPRTVDLDLALFGDTVHASASLATPHPRLHFRRFVLAPAAEVAPNAMHPLLETTLAELNRSAAALTQGEHLLAFIGGDPTERDKAIALFAKRHPKAKIVGLPPDALPASALLQAGTVIGARPAVHLPGVEDRRLERDLDRVWDASRTKRLWIALMVDVHPSSYQAGDQVAPAVDLRAVDPDGRRRELIHFMESLAQPFRK